MDGEADEAGGGFCYGGEVAGGEVAGGEAEGGAEEGVGEHDFWGGVQGCLLWEGWERGFTVGKIL